MTNNYVCPMTVFVRPDVTQVNMCMDIEKRGWWKGDKCCLFTGLVFSRNKMCLLNTMPPIMANCNEGQCHTRTNILIPVERYCHKKWPCAIWKHSLITNVIFSKRFIKCQGQKVKYQQKYIITRDIHVKYQSYSNHNSD